MSRVQGLHFDMWLVGKVGAMSSLGRTHGDTKFFFGEIYHKPFCEYLLEFFIFGTVMFAHDYRCIYTIQYVIVTSRCSDRELAYESPHS